MKLKDLITPPVIFKNKLKDSFKLSPIITNMTSGNGEYLLSYKCGQYNIKFQFIGEQFNINNKIKIYCNCPSFNFEFAHILNDDKSLFDSHLFKHAMQKTPHKKNKYNLLCGCKHCIACARLTYNKFDLLQTKI